MTRPEDKARDLIDQRLQQGGWAVQDMTQFNPAASRGVAVREFPTDTGPADCVLLVDREPVGVIEATLAAAQRQNILSAAFSGQLVPQDPNDEPAIVLLERIRAERLARTTVPSVRRSRAAGERA